MRARYPTPDDKAHQHHLLSQQQEAFVAARLAERCVPLAARLP